MIKTIKNNNPYSNNRKFRHVSRHWIGYLVSISGTDIFLFVPEEDRVACLNIGDVVEIQ